MRKILIGLSILFSVSLNAQSLKFAPGTSGGGGSLDSNNLWKIHGNSSTNPTVNFIGTTDEDTLVIKANNQRVGFFDLAKQNYSFGQLSNPNGTGDNNVALGLSALKASTTGYHNTAIGSLALTNTTTGYHNASVGDSSCQTNVTGFHNTTIGSNSDVAASSTNSATALGVQTTAKDSSIAIGVDANATVSRTAVFSPHLDSIKILSGTNGHFLGIGASGYSTYRAPFTLTTTGSSGAATYSGGTLNIPQYSGLDTSDLPYVTPEDFGAAGDGTTNDLTAIQNAVNSGKPVWFGHKTYLVGSTISLPAKAQLIGSGAGSILYMTANDTIASVNGSNVQIKGLTFRGNNSGAAQTGLCIVGNAALTVQYTSCQISDCLFQNLNFAGLFAKDATGDLSEGAAYVSNTIADSCGTGFYLADEAEYNTFANCVAFACTVGFKNDGGNNNWVGGQITDCVTGVSLGNSVNDSHAVMSGAKINHNTTNISALSVTYGYLFSGCYIQVGNITLVTSNALRFVGCDIANCTTLTVTTCTNTQFTECQFRNTNPTLTLTGTSPIFLNNYWLTGTCPSYAQITPTVSFGSIYFDNNNTRLGIGTASPAGALHASATVNGTHKVSIENLSNGNGAFATVETKNDAGNLARLLTYGSGVATSAYLQASYSNLYTSGGGLNFTTDGGSFPFKWFTGATQLATLTSGGLLGIGVTPSAYVDIAAGTTSAASVQINPGVAPSSPTDGDVWYENTNDKLMFRKNATSAEIIATSAVNSVSPTAPDRTLTVVINGTTYYIPAKTTND